MGLVVVFLVLILTRLHGSRNTDRPTPTAMLIVLANPSSTSDPTLTPTPRQTLSPTATETSPVQQNPELDIGVLVEVFGTDGDGLRIRTQPSLDSEIRFIGLDHEVFRVIAGPERSNEYRWWQLENPFDQSKTGWAVDLFLRPVSNP